METRRGGPPSGPTALFRAVVSKLHETRRGVHQHRMVRALLQRGANGLRLVGLAANTRRAVFFDPASRTFEPIPFDREGTHEEHAEVLSRRLSDPSSWTEADAARLSWVHLHFRWVCGLDDAERSWASSRKSAIRCRVRP